MCFLSDRVCSMPFSGRKITFPVSGLSKTQNKLDKNNFGTAKKPLRTEKQKLYKNVFKHLGKMQGECPHQNLIWFFCTKDRKNRLHNPAVFAPTRAAPILPLHAPSKVAYGHCLFARSRPMPAAHHIKMPRPKNCCSPAASFPSPPAILPAKRYDRRLPLQYNNDAFSIE